MKKRILVMGAAAFLLLAAVAISSPRVLGHDGDTSFLEYKISDLESKINDLEYRVNDLEYEIRKLKR